MAASQTMTLHKVKETKNTVRFDGDTSAIAIPAVYIQKEFLPNPYPERIKLTLEFE